MARPIVTDARLRQLLHYDPLTGVFTALVNRGRVRAGDVLGGPDDGGYIRIVVDGRTYKAHRLAWFYMMGKWPPQEIDHENTIRSDNWWDNLRLATRVQNKQNQRRAMSSNKCGFLGVSRRGAKWEARIVANGKKLFLGLFATPQLAHAAYLEAKARLHPFQTLT